MEVRREIIKKFRNTCFIVLSVCICLIVLIFTRYQTQSSPAEIRNKAYIQDSTKVMDHKHYLIKNFVKQALRDKKDLITGVIKNHGYDSKVDAHWVRYAYIHNKDIKSDGSAYQKDVIDRYIWIKLKFNSNNGDYKIDYDIVKTARRTIKDFPDTLLIYPKEYCKSTYKD